MSAVVVSSLSVFPARAIGTCTLTGVNGTYKVGKMVIPDGADVGMSWQHRDPVQVPFADSDGYYGVVGVYVVNAHSRAVRAFAADAGGAGAPRVAVEVNGTTYVNGEIPSTRASGVHGGVHAFLPPALPGGTYWVVGFGSGAAEGATGTGTWTVAVNTGIGCPEVAVPGEIRDYNQADFSGGTQVYAPSVGIASNVKLSLQLARNTVLGAMCAQVLPGGTSRLAYQYPVGQSGQVNSNFRALMGQAGTYSFTANYQGVDPLININFVALDLPNP